MTAAFNIALPAPELKAVITGFLEDGEPIWSTELRHRVRDGRGGQIEIPAQRRSRMNAHQIQERYAGHPFVDYFDCMIEGIRAAKRRNKLAVRAYLEGRGAEADRQREHRDYYLKRARQWRDLIDWSDE
jgi:hypothetical protein